MSCEGYAPFFVSAQQDAVLQRIEAAAGPGDVAVFDLDGCLFDNRPRQVHIYQEYAARHDLPALYRVGAQHFSDWSLARTMVNAGVDRDLVARIRRDFRDFWGDRFFTSAYTRFDHPMPGAVRLVRAVAARGAHIVYLTGRDHTMHAGSAETLDRFSFPWGDGATLLTKPETRMADDAWKAQALSQVAALGRPVVFMDNEPANANLFHAAHPDALVVFVSTDHSFRDVAADPALPRIRGFLRTTD